MDNQVPEQRKSEKYVSVSMSFIFVAHGADKITLTMGHEEIDRIQPFKSVMVIDATFTLSESDARKLAEVLNQHAFTMIGEAAIRNGQEK